jgi:hypothetical protein
MRLIALPLLVFVACAAPQQPTPVNDANVGLVIGTSPLPAVPPDAPRERFPAGRGVGLLIDDLRAMMANTTFSDRKVTYEDRLTLARKALGEQGTPVKDEVVDGTSFVGLGPRGAAGPYSCQELVVSRNSPLTGLIRATDMARCGLPYMEDPTKPYHGPGPSATRRELQRLSITLANTDPLTAEQEIRKQLGAPDHKESPQQWIGIGPPGKDGPFTCHVLQLGTKLELFEAPFERCGFIWPPPPSRFERGPDLPPLDTPQIIADCNQKCSTTEICMLDQRVAMGSANRHDADGKLRSTYPDGRPAKNSITPSCIPVPATCTKLEASCFFGIPSPISALPKPNLGPCPATDHPDGHSFQGRPKPHIECYSRSDKL